MTLWPEDLESFQTGVGIGILAGIKYYYSPWD